ncbi:protein kinase domain-containing protein [Chitinophaga sp. NPDC101104]|uniref:class III lanthionine synthetase LanKC N-terminal domain-containing protein n=1 Tax=Chitinophaga sp. NPDC101104 TaxID=3390561 RepID=UPI003D06E90D
MIKNNLYNRDIESIDWSEIDDYSVHLDNFGITYDRSGFHYVVNKPKLRIGWILHVSVIIREISELLKYILPVLQERKVAFKIVQNIQAAKNIQYGEGGKELIGKIITIYPDSIEDARELATILINITKPFQGPEVLTDYWLGGTVYTRYGIFEPGYTYNENGERLRATKLENGSIVIDYVSIPFNLQESVAWPFESITKFSPKEQLTTHIGPYKIVHTLSSHPKGNVYLVVDENDKSQRPLIIKQGIKHMWSDESNRDMTDRIEWQYKVHKSLEQKIPIPKIEDYFSQAGDSYLAMEYVQGIPLIDARYRIVDDCAAWFAIEKNKQLLILNIAYQVTEIIEAFHIEGLLHRDLTPANFLLDINGVVRPIDVETAYRYWGAEQFPPFQYGTKGYAAPNNEKIGTPIPQDDIYGLGALLFFLLTGLSPHMFTMYERNNTEISLEQLIGKNRISSIICCCLDNNPSNRPTIEILKTEIFSYCEELSEDKHLEEKPQQIPLPISKIKDAIQKSINGLTSPPTEIAEGLWLTLGRGMKTENKSMYHSHRLDNGISGILLLLSIAKANGYDITSGLEMVKKGIAYLQTKFISFYPKVSPGLYDGAAGVSLSMLKSISAGLHPYNLTDVAICKNLMLLNSNDPSIAQGISGQALAIIESRAFWQEDEFKTQLKTLHDKLVAAMIEAGEWSFMIDENEERKYLCSFSLGNCGPIYFLLKYYKIFPNIETQQHLDIGLEKLIKISEGLIRKHSEISTAQFSKEYPGLESINAAAYVLLMAYEIFREERFLIIADQLIDLRNPYELHQLFDLDSGLSGLGILLLYGHKCTGRSEYFTRATWIANVFCGLSFQFNSNSSYWVGSTRYNPIAELIEGNCGIILFLMEYEKALSQTQVNKHNV